MIEERYFILFISENRQYIFDDFYDYDFTISNIVLIDDYYHVNYSLKEKDRWDNRHGSISIREKDIKSFLRNNKIDLYLT